MGIWEVNNISAAVKSKSYNSVSTNNVAFEYSKILAEKIANVKADVQAMQTVQEQLDEISDLHEELTGKVKVEEDSGNANREDDGAEPNIICVEKVKRYLPDGSIMITTYEDGKIAEQVKKKPHMISVPDYSAPPKADGSPDTKLEPRQSLDLMELLMM